MLLLLPLLAGLGLVFCQSIQRCPYISPYISLHTYMYVTRRPVPPQTPYVKILEVDGKKRRVPNSPDFSRNSAMTLPGSTTERAAISFIFTFHTGILSVIILILIFRAIKKKNQSGGLQIEVDSKKIQAALRNKQRQRPLGIPIIRLGCSQ